MGLLYYLVAAVGRVVEGLGADLVDEPGDSLARCVDSCNGALGKHGHGHAGRLHLVADVGVSSGVRPPGWYYSGIRWAIASYFFSRRVRRSSDWPTRMSG